MTMNIVFLLAAIGSLFSFWKWKKSDWINLTLKSIYGILFLLNTISAVQGYGFTIAHVPTVAGTSLILNIIFLGLLAYWWVSDDLINIGIKAYYFSVFLISVFFELMRCGVIR